MKTLKNLSLLLLTLTLGVLPLWAAPTGHFERNLQVSGPVDLDIMSGSGDITIRTGGSGSISISARIHSSGSWLFGSGDAEERIRRIEKNPPVVQQGNSIRIGHFEDRDMQRNISIDYEVTVPAQTRLTSHTGSGDQTFSGLQLPLSATTGSGNITLDNISADTRIRSGSGDLKINNVKGTLNAETGSGNIRAQGVAGEITSNTGSGDVEMHQTAAGDVRVGTGSGNVKLYGIKGGLRAETGSGDILVEGEATHDWRLGAGSGNITLRLPTQASFNLNARTSSGSLRVKPAVTMQGDISKNHIQGKVGNGGVIVDLHTGSGDIEID
jgi:hypothetical protein